MNHSIAQDYDVSEDDSSVLASATATVEKSSAKAAKRRHDADVRRNLEDYLERQRLRKLLNDELEGDYEFDF